jgi:hypothetical protein
LSGFGIPDALIRKLAKGLGRCGGRAKKKNRGIFLRCAGQKNQQAPRSRSFFGLADV